jgi:hypothetical protein
MRKLIISLAATGAVVAFAAPAAAQYQPQAQGYAQPYAQPYGAPYGNRYGHNNFGRVRALQARVDQIQRNLGQLVQRRLISGNEYRNRQEGARDIERRLRRDARDGRGLSGNEVNGIENRIVRLEQKIARDMRDGRRWDRRY